MGERYLIDTSAAIKYLNETFSANALQWLDSIVDTECNVSVITQMELMVWQTEDETETNTLKSFVESASIFHLSDTIVHQTIKTRKTFKIKLPDSIIAATALIHGFTLVADNDKDFLKVANLAYINPKNI